MGSVPFIKETPEHPKEFSAFHTNYRFSGPSLPEPSSYIMFHKGKRMIQQHAGSRKTHDFTDTCAHVRLVAMYFAGRASRLRIPERATVQTHVCISLQLSARRAQRVRTVPPAAIQGQHLPYDLLFIIQLTTHICLTAFGSFPKKTKPHSASEHGFYISKKQSLMRSSPFER